MRLFAAVWPPDDVLDHLDLALGAVRSLLPGDGTGPVRWSARETWHLTCAFYGEVPDGLVPELTAALAAAAAGRAPYSLRLRGAGVFSHRTLWVGVGGDTVAQQALTRVAIEAGEAVGVRPDARPRERAHLTIGRVRTPDRRSGRGAVPGRGAVRGRGAALGRGDVAPARGVVPGRGTRGPDAGVVVDPESLVGALAVYEGPGWTVDALRLVASRPGEGRGGGPLYRVVGELGLGERGPVAPWAP